MTRDTPTIWLGKAVYWGMRKVGRHGAALPGLIVEKINPSMITRAFEGLPYGVVVITGTNGKTTTTHLVAAACRNAGLRVFTNHSGSNMTRGLLASIVRFARFDGSLPYDIAVLEVDEAYAAKLSSALKPRYSILTNVLRDQLDRFGEIDHTAKLLGELAKHTTQNIIANGQDPRIVGVLSRLKTKASIVWFGHAEVLKEHFPTDDDWHGGSQKYAKPKEDWFVLESMKTGGIELTSPKAGKVTISTQLDGWHNGINMCAAYALINSILKNVDSSLFDNLGAPYGRGEIVVVNGVEVTLQLVKNPAGFRIAMGTRPDKPACIIINDAYADSRDVSWLWDVDVKELRSRSAVLTSGSRAKDMAVRLKYSDISVVSSATDIESSLDEFIHAYKGGVVFLTYTAMLKSRSILKSMAEKYEHKKVQS